MLRAEAALSDSIESVELSTLMQSKEAGMVASGWSVLDEPLPALVTLGSATAALDPSSSFEIFSAPKLQSSVKPDLLSSACKFDTVCESALLAV